MVGIVSIKNEDAAYMTLLSQSCRGWLATLSTPPLDPRLFTYYNNDNQ